MSTNISAVAQPRMGVAVHHGAAAADEIVIILGMHRSATSLLAGALQRIGVDMADGDLRADKHNPGGYFERWHIADLHERILNALSRTWHSMTPLPSGWWRDPLIAPMRRQLVEILKSKLNEAGRPWGFKDPRTMLLLPMWIEVLDELGIQARFILALRNPDDVASSLSQRNGFEHDVGLTLWSNYHLEALPYLRRIDPCCASYDDWLESPSGTARRIVSELRLEKWTHLDSIDDVIENWVHIDWNHGRSNFSRRSRSFSHWLFDKLQDLKDPALRPAAFETFTKVSTERNIFLRLYSRLFSNTGAMEGHIANQAKEIHALKTDLASARAGAPQAPDTASALSLQLSDSEHRIHTLEARTKELETLLEQALADHRNAAQRAYEDKDRALADEASKTLAAQSALTEIETKLALATTQEAALQLENNRLRTRAADLSDAYNDLEAKLSESDRANSDISLEKDELRAQLKSQRGEITRLTAELEAEKRRRLGLSEEVSAGNARQAELSSRMAALQFQFSEAESAQRALQGQLTLSQSELSKANAEMDVLRSKIRSAEDEASTTKKKSEEDLSHAIGARDQAEAALRGNVAELKRTRERVGALEGDIKQLIDLNSKLEADAAKIEQIAKATISELSTRLDTQKQELSAARASFGSENTSASLPEIIAALTMRLNNAELGHKEALREQALAAQRINEFAEILSETALRSPDSTTLPSAPPPVEHTDPPDDLLAKIAYMEAEVQALRLGVSNLLSKADLFKTEGEISSGEKLTQLLNFDSESYLRTNADVASALVTGALSSAFEHWKLAGLVEGRMGWFAPGSAQDKTAN